MEVVKKLAETALEAPSDVERQYGNDISRAPIFFWIGWIVVAYFALFLLTFYVAPFLFGTRPYRPFFYARNVHPPGHIHHHRPGRHTGQLPLDPEDAQQLTQNITQAIAF